MTEKDRRRFERHDSLHLIQFVVIGDGDAPAFEGMGRTLNISEQGILLETFFPLADGQQVLLTVGLEEEMVEVQGRVIYVRQGPGESCHSGIEFAAIDPAAAAVVRRYLQAFRSAHPA